MLDVIKEYLISLGFNVDNKSYNQAMGTMDKAEKSVSKFAGNAVTKFALAGTAVTTFVAATSIGIAKFLGDLAKADLQTEKLARQLWISKDNAMAFNNTLKAMGVTLQDLYLSPELMRNFQTLRDQSKSMQAPHEFQEQMKYIRSIQFEFTRMKLEATYALQWIGYYFIKYMSGPITNIKLTLKDINDMVVKTMPHWTKTIAQVMSWFAQFGVTSVKSVKDIIQIIKDADIKIPKSIKEIGLAILGLAVLIKTGPVGTLITIFTILILLLDDFYSYLNGGKSKFAPLWKSLIEFYDKLRDTGTIDKFKQSLSDALEWIAKKIDDAKAGLKTFYTDLQNNEVMEKFKQAFNDVFVTVNNLINDANSNLKGDNGLYDAIISITTGVADLSKGVGDMIKAFSGLKETKTAVIDPLFVALQGVLRAIQEMGSLLSAIGKLMSGDFKGAWNSFYDFLNPKMYNKDGTLDMENEKRRDSGRNIFNSTGSSLWKGYKSLQDRFNNSYANMQAYEKSVNQGSYYNYSQPQTNNNNVSLRSIYNIYGSDANATAKKANNYTEDFLMRNFQGVIR